MDIYKTASITSETRFKYQLICKEGDFIIRIMCFRNIVLKLDIISLNTINLIIMVLSVYCEKKNIHHIRILF